MCRCLPKGPIVLVGAIGGSVKSSGSSPRWSWLSPNAVASRHRPPGRVRRDAVGQAIGSAPSAAVAGVLMPAALSWWRAHQTAIAVHLVTVVDGKVARFQEFFDTWVAAEAFRAG